MKKIIFLLPIFCFITMTSIAQLGVEFSVRLNADGITYEAYMRPNVTWTAPENITGTGQFSIKVPTGTMVVTNFSSNGSFIGSGAWQSNTPVITPPESPDFDYFPFGYNGGSRQYPYSPGVEVILFTFNNGMGCNGTVEVIDNFSDPFATMQSSINIGNSLVTLGSQGILNGSGNSNAWFGNYEAQENCSVLPIDLVSFEADGEDCQNTITWTTATEDGVDYFELQRSGDGTDFYEITRVTAVGGTNSTTYKYLDEDGYNDYYYRLKSVDLDGSFELHPLIYVRSSCCFDQNIEDFTVAPNPAFGQTNIQFSWCLSNASHPGHENQVTIRIFDQLGRAVLNSSVTDLYNGSNRHSIDLSGLPPAIYFVRLESEDWNSEARRFIKF